MNKIFAFAVIVLLSACGTKKELGKPGKILGTTWELDNIEGFKSESLERPVTLHFTDATRVSGNAGCNTFGGDYKRTGSSLEIKNVVSTRMACKPGMATEQEYLKVLSKTTKMLIKDGKLMLWDGGEKLATLSPGSMIQKK